MFRKSVSRLFRQLRSPSRKPRLSLEALEPRDMFATFTWIGASAVAGDPSTAYWTKSGNWLRDGQPTVQTPAQDDDVIFKDRDGSTPLTAAGLKPEMEAPYTVKSLTIQAVPNAAAVISGAAYLLKLDGKLTIKGPTTSTISDGTVTGGEVEFSPPAASDGPTFTWKGGTLDTPVIVSKETKLVISTLSYKMLKQKLQVNSLDAKWDGLSFLDTPTSGFCLQGTNAELSIGVGAKFVIDASLAAKDSFLSLYLDSKISNRGTVTVKLAAAHTLDLGTPGWTLNYSRIELTQGTILSRNLLNAGEIKVNAGTKVKMGTTQDVDVLSSLYLDSSQSVLTPATSAFIGGGKLELSNRSYVTIPGGTAYVANVDDYSKGTTGAGTLIITGNYLWARPDPNKRESAPWTGPGTTQVGSDTERSAKLILSAVKHGTERPIVCYGWIEWKSSTIAATIPNPLPPAPGGGVFVWTDLTFFTVGVEIKPRVDTASAFWPTFEIDSTGDFNQWMSGNIKNAGRVKATTDTLIESKGEYKAVGGGDLDVKKRTGKGEVKIDGKTRVSMGTIEVGDGATLALLGGFEDTGADVTNAGELDVMEGWDKSGGTVDSDGTGVEPTLVTVDRFTQTGGDVTSAAPWTVTGDYILSLGSFTSAGDDGADPITFSAGTETQSGGAIVSTGSWTVVGAYNLSDGSFTSQTGGLAAPTFTADSIMQSGGTIASAGAATINNTYDMTGGEIDNSGRLVVANGFNLAGGTVNSQGGNLMDPGSVTIDTLTQTGGTVTSKMPWTVTGLFTESGGMFTQAGDFGTDAPFQAGALTQTNGGLTFVASNANSTFNVGGLYDFAGGTANVQEPAGYQPNQATLSQLLVDAGGITFGGSFGVTNGIDVTPNGTLILFLTANVTADILVDGTLHASWESAMTGNLTNNGLVHLGLPGEINSTNILNITGNYTQTGGATLLMDLAGMSSTGSGSDRLNVTGNASLAGSLVLLTPPGTGLGGTYTLMTYGSRSGMFGSVSVPSGSGLVAWYDNPTANAMGVW